jgi:hypothetical protein
MGLNEMLTGLTSWSEMRACGRLWHAMIYCKITAGSEKYLDTLSLFYILMSAYHGPLTIVLTVTTV